MTALLEVSSLCAGYERRDVVHDVDLTVSAGEVVCLLGPNGAGKSTVLGALTGLVDVSSGAVTVDDTTITARSTHAIARSGVAHVPEDRSLFPSLTVRDHLRLADTRVARRRAAGSDALGQVLEWFPALERLMGTRVGLLSGGEQQMVAIGRAVMNRPRVLLIDEMSLGLAPIVVRSLLEVIGRLATETGCGVLLVEQHVALALDVAERAYVLSRGRITYAGDSETLAGDHDTLVAGYLGTAGPNSVTVMGS